jgi:hypothetical protein
MDTQRPPTRKDQMMRRDLFPPNELHPPAEVRWMRFEQQSSLVNKSNEPPLDVLLTVS